jgi:hypothetical protein
MAHSDYYIKGFKVPSVTEVTGLLDKGPQFNEWLMREGQHAKDIGREARDRGTAVHEAARMATDGVPRLPGDDEDLTEVCAANLTAWLKAHVRLSYFTEQPVHNARYLYAGTPDNVCLLEEANDGHVFLLDYKNSGAPELYPAWTAQVAAYCYSDEVLRIVGHRQIHGAVITVNYKTDCQPKLTLIPNLKAEFTLFLHLLTAYHCIAKRRTVKVNTDPQLHL